MAQSKLEKLRAENKELKDAEEIQALEKENKHLKCVADKTLPDGTKISIVEPSIATITKAYDMDDDEARGKYLIEAICTLSPEQIEALSYEKYAIYKDIVQSFF